MIDNVTRLMVLLEEIDWLRSQIQPHDTGHIHTTISTLKSRCWHIEQNLSEKDRVFVQLKFPERNTA
jgi:hypothetical protein